VPFLIPTSIEVGGTNWSHVGWTSKDAPSHVDPALPARRLTVMFNMRGMPVIDLAQSLRARGGAALYFPSNGHWTEQGHAAAGAALAPAIAKALGRPL
jgi:hypothetical protein